jgi:CO/xanthine dehydrogenase Mo-binding subunit
MEPTHSTGPAALDGDNNLLASWYVAEPSQPGPPTNIPQPAGGGDRNAVPLRPPGRTRLRSDWYISAIRARAVIQTVTRRVAWKGGRKGDGTRGRGVAFAKYKNLATYVAVVAEVEIDRQTDRVRVPRAFAAADAGQIINPDGATNQVEGGMIQSTSWTLHEAVRFDRNGITSRDWSGYPILTMPKRLKSPSP